jgi:hypothetical protein
MTVERNQADAAGSNPFGIRDLPYGAFTKIARRMRPQVSPNHVREVFFGRRESPRVAGAIKRYIERAGLNAA